LNDALKLIFLVKQQLLMRRPSTCAFCDNDTNKFTGSAVFQNSSLSQSPPLSMEIRRGRLKRVQRSDARSQHRISRVCWGQNSMQLNFAAGTLP